MSEGTKFTKGQYFAWGSTLYRALRDCEVWSGVMMGEAEYICQFENECEPEIAVTMIKAIGGDSRYLMIGSDTGMDDDAPDEEDEI